MTTHWLEAVDGERVSIGDAAERWRYGDAVELRPPRVDAVRAIATALSRDEARQLVELLSGYPAFVPALGHDVREAMLLELLAASTGDVVPFELALAVEVDGAGAVRRLVERVLTFGLHRTHRDRVVTLLSFLLDQPEARAIAAGVMVASREDAARSIVEELALDRDVEWPRRG